MKLFLMSPRNTKTPFCIWYWNSKKAIRWTLYFFVSQFIFPLSLKTQIRPSRPKVPSSHCPSHPLATTIDENQTVYTMDESKVRGCERLLLNWTDLEASIKNQRYPHVNGPRQFSYTQEPTQRQLVEQNGINLFLH